MKSKFGTLLMAAVIAWSLVGTTVSAADRSHGRRQRSKSVRGYFCGQQSGNRSGDFYFRVGRVLRVFNMAFGIEAGGNAKIIGFKFNDLKIGNEYLIVYRADDGEDGYIESIKFTGRKKSIAPCPVD